MWKVSRLNRQSADFEKVLAIRQQVFVEGQGVPASLEHDDDKVQADYILIQSDEQAVATARWRELQGVYKLERFAVLATNRGKGLGKALVEAVLSEIGPTDRLIYLHAQLPVVSFYEKLGFVKDGPLFEEAGIQHYKMYFKAE
jgi:predicted GNAT family N-acyltransferase